jgi:sterol 3beta-glucosyltransferase
VRAIIAKGWSARDSKDADDVAFPPSCYSVDKVPHGWLFPKIDAAMHHGGAGTTGASLRAGLPTLIKPWFGDQYFWALRVAKLGAGTRVSSLRADDIADALRKATTSTVMIEKAARIGERIRGESGVDVAVQTINFNLVRAAKNRSKLKKEDNRNRADASGGIKLGLPSLPSITCPTSA